MFWIDFVALAEVASCLLFDLLVFGGFIGGKSALGGCRGGCGFGLCFAFTCD